MIRTSSCCLFVVALLLVPAATAESGDAFDEAVKAYEAGIVETALVRRTQARARLAMSRDVRALQILANDYAKPEAPKDQVRYLIAHVSSRYFTDAEWADPYQTWLDRYVEPRDAWLWFLGRSVRAAHASEPELVEQVDPDLDIFLRAAAIEAVAAAKRKAAVHLISDVLDGLPKKGLERGVLLASLASVALSLEDHIGDEALLPPLVRLVEQIDAKATPDWAGLAIARHVCRLVGMPDVTLQTPYLVSLLEGRSGPRSTDDDRYGQPTFMGVKASGTRLCYVIDCSDSMLTPLTGKEQESVRPPAITGAGTPKKNSKKDGVDIDWEGVRTRFDLAREYLKLSLRALSKDKSFAVVCFGSGAALLDGTKGMVPATKGNVKKAVRALDGMKAGPATETRVHGTLMGDTNFHAAFMSAFGVVSKGMTKEPEYVARAGFDEGADTIFFLSDGKPTADNWPGEGPMSGPGGFRDRETGKRIEPPAGGGGTGPTIHAGPYADGGFYLNGEVQRMNLFRKAEIHCIGIGEARKWQLETIAKIGLGRVRMIGGDDDD